jgi:hypothetical protein
MYLSKQEITGRLHYLICQSYREGQNKLKSRTLFDLGEAPSKYIMYPGGNSYYIHEEVELSILEMGVEVDTFELQDLFWPFLDYRLRRVLTRIRRPEKKFKSINPEKLQKMQEGIHIFDKRRVHFLRYGLADQRHLDSVPYRFFNRLLDKSRDEIECRIEEYEGQCLRTGEYKIYVYTIFNLQRFFSSNSVARCAPFILDQDEVDDYFLQEICRLNHDKTFYHAETRAQGLHQYLVKYLIMYFDNSYVRTSNNQTVFDEFFKQRGYLQQPAQQMMSIAESFKLLEIHEEDYRHMSQEQLRRVFRRIAHKCHPDKGGDHDKFICVCKAFERLMDDKKRK